MYQSLKAVSGEFHLYIFAFDNVCSATLKLFKPDFVTIITLDEFENQELLEVKKTRTKAEYCWTCTPAVISYSIKKFNLPECTYIDSDLYFYSDPSVLLEELRRAGKGVLITEHKFALLPKWHGQKRAGRFCVQFLTVKNNAASMQVLETWRNQCLEWCYARYEDGKFGDQKYLEDWPVKYNNIHILEHAGAGIAPWNVNNYRFRNDNGRIFVAEKNTGREERLIFFHFQYVKRIDERVFDIGWYCLKPNQIKLLYVPYLNRIIEIENEIKSVNNDYIPGILKNSNDDFHTYIKHTFKKLFGYNLLKV